MEIQLNLVNNTFNTDQKISLSLDGASFDVQSQELWNFIEETFNLFINKKISIGPQALMTITKNNYKFRVVTSNNYFFWKELERGSWEPATFRLFDKFISRDTVYIDVGAWIGPTLLYASNLARVSYAFEPDPIAFRELELNVHANQVSGNEKDVNIYNKAVSPKSGSIVIGNRNGGGDSMSSSLFTSAQTKWEVEAINLVDFLKSINVQNKVFIKIDIEGGEYQLIPSIKQLSKLPEVILFVSLHHDFLMSSLRTRNEENILEKIKRRLKFFGSHLNLIRALTFKYFYNISGQSISPYKMLLDALFRGRFLHEIVVMNKEWKANQ